MDLGYGASNQVVGSVAARALLTTAAIQEKVLDEEIAKYDSVLFRQQQQQQKNQNETEDQDDNNNNKLQDEYDDEDEDDEDEELARIRAARRRQMQAATSRQEQWRAAGHGSYTELQVTQDGRDIVKEFWQVTKQSERVIVHFYRPTTARCEIVHEHLTNIANRHWETRFLKINVESVATTNISSGGGGNTGVAYLVEKFNIAVLPTITVIHQRKVVHHMFGFLELGNVDDFTTTALTMVLGKHKGLMVTEEERATFEEERDVVATAAVGAGGKHWR